MSDKSNIEWTDATWNPLRGTKGNWHCTKISPGCQQCYAERMNIRFGGPKYVEGADTIRLNEHVLNEPVRWKRPRMIFVCSMTDLFHETVSGPTIGAIFGIMAITPWHTYQVLTKRTERAKSMLGQLEFELEKLGGSDLIRSGNPGFTWPLPNVWIGTSVESQKYANERIPHLLETPAAVRFLSCEPLLDEVDLLDFPLRENLHWVIVGGESGPAARPMQPDWARKIRDQCSGAGIPFFFKQWGEHMPLDEPAGSGPSYFKRMGKKKSGRRLDGRVYDQMPTISMEGKS